MQDSRRIRSCTLAICSFWLRAGPHVHMCATTTGSNRPASCALCPMLCRLICFMPSHRSAVGPKCVECACCVWGCITEWACGSGVPPRTTACVEGGATGIVALTLSGAMVQLASRRAGRGPPGWGAFSSRNALHLLGGLLYPLLHQRPAQQARDPHTGVDAGGSDAGGRRQSRNWLHAGGRAGTCCNCMQRRARPPCLCSRAAAAPTNSDPTQPCRTQRHHRT